MATIADDTKRDTEVPPVDVMWITSEKGNNYFFATGGCHRFAAHERLKKPTIRAKLIKSTRSKRRHFSGYLCIFSWIFFNLLQCQLIDIYFSYFFFFHTFFFRGLGDLYGWIYTNATIIWECIYLIWICKLSMSMINLIVHRKIILSFSNMLPVSNLDRPYFYIYIYYKCTYTSINYS